MTITSYSSLLQNLVTATKTLFPANKVIRGNGNGSESDNPYISIKVIRDTQLGMATQDTRLSTANKSVVQANYEVLVQFGFISKDEDAAGNLAKTFVQYMNTSLTREVFRVNNLSKLSISSIRNVAYQRETVWTQDFNVDVTFVYMVSTEQTMIPIVAVQLEDEISGEVFIVPPDVVITP